MAAANATTEPSIGKELEELAGQLSAAAKDFSAVEAQGADAVFNAKYAVWSSAQKILALTKKPEDQWFDQSIIMTEFPAIRMFMKWGAFDIIPREPGSSITYKELAEKLDAEESLVTRLAWMMVCMGTLKQIGEDRVAHTPNSLIYLDFHPLGIMYQIMFDEALLPYAKYPEYFEKYGRKEPTTQNHNPYTFSQGRPEQTVWEIMNSRPERMQAFMQSMNTLEQHLPITGMYSFDWVVDKAKEDPERVLFVDVGGGKGQAIKAISKENPGIPRDRMILQDRPDVIEEVTRLDAEELRGAKLMAHNFHEEQPIKGALIYWMRRCIHDYGDSDCICMLKQLADAMVADSKCLIVEQVMTNPPTPLVAYTDVCMINIGGKERTLKGFESLASSAGLKIVKVWPSKTSAVSVVETVKA